MTNYKSLTFNPPYLFGLCLSLCLSLIIGCDKKSEGSSTCNPITLNKPFTAKIGDTYCLPSDSGKITFGPFIEDSRCNVPQIECVWAGRYVMAVTIDNGEIQRDTFFAERDWKDTLQAGGYAIILNKVFPEIRQSMEPLDTAGYSFEIIVK